MADENPADLRSHLDGSDVRRELRLKLKHHVVSKAEQFLLSKCHLDPRDGQTWKSGAFERWLSDPWHAVWPYTRESNLLPLAIRGVASGLNGPRMPWHYRWTRAFRTYCHVSERVALESALLEIVTAQDDWAHPTALPLMGLAWACVETAVKGDDRAQLHMAQLVTRLYGAFAKLKSPVLAVVFGELLKRCVWEEFEAWWKPGQWSLSSPAYRGILKALVFALSSVSFIGKLYRFNILPVDFIYRVIEILLPQQPGKQIAIEQLHAVRVLFILMDARLEVKDPARMVKVTQAFTDCCKQVCQSWMSESPLNRTEVITLHQDVCSIIGAWKPSSLPPFREAFPGQPVIKPQLHPASSSYSSGFSSPSTSSSYLPPPPYASSSSLPYSNSPGTSYATPCGPTRR